jgi:[ribosomal protein S5]-alanine N-acetyltransferase
MQLSLSKLTIVTPEAMMPVLQTERLTLRPWTRGDGPALQEIFDDADVRRYLFDDVPVTLERAESILEMHLALEQSLGIGYWFVILADEKIGFAGVSGDEEEAELMYGLLPRHWGHGYATEAARAVLDHARAAGYTRILGRTDPPNEKSMRVMERLGMRRRGVESGPQGQPLVVYDCSLSQTA